MAYKFIDKKEKVYARAYRIPIDFSNSSSWSVNVKAKFPNDYMNLTNQDFIASYVSDAWSGSLGTVSTQNHDNEYTTLYIPEFSIRTSYNASTGILTVTPSSMLQVRSRFPHEDPKDFPMRNLQAEVLVIINGVRTEYA